MAYTRIQPSEEEVLNALQEYFAPDGSEQFTKMYIQQEVKNDEGEKVNKIIVDPQIVLEGERSKVDKEKISLFQIEDEKSEE